MALAALTAESPALPSNRGGGALLRVFTADPPLRVNLPGPARRMVPRPLPGVSGDTVSPRAFFIGVAPTLLEPPLTEMTGVAASAFAEALGGDWRRSRPRPSTAARTARPGDMTSPLPGDIMPMPNRPGDMNRPGEIMW